MKSASLLETDLDLHILRQINATDRLYVLRSATAWNVAVLSPLLGITWLFGVLSVSKQLVVFQYLFAISNTLQVQYITCCCRCCACLVQYCSDVISLTFRSIVCCIYVKLHHFCRIIESHNFTR